MTTASEFNRSLSIESSTSAAHDLQLYLLDLLSQRNCPENILFGIRIALEEALMNAIKHGNQRDSTKKITIDYQLLLLTSTKNTFELKITITDQGNGFNPQDVPDPTLPENLEKLSGRGMLLINNYMENVQHNNTGNSITFTKQFTPSPELQLQEAS